jgi:hypothetical protein
MAGEEPAPHMESSAVALPILAPPPISVPLRVSFSNSLAVRLCFLVASVASVLDAMPAVQLLCILWSLCAGFIAVVLYRRATGQSLNIRDGAKMGWITGVLNSLILTVLTTISVASNSTELNAAFREQVRAKAPNDATALALVNNPYVLASGILFLLVLIFVVVTGACVAGGALGARMMRDDRAADHLPR